MKTKNHKRITELALDLCKNKLSDEILKYKKEIIQGSEDEDATELISRAFHWHFYRQKNSPIPKKVKKFFNPTSEIIFQKRIEQFKKEKNLKRKYNLLGRILHHIQDMTTPAHVLPIYHGPSVPFKLKKEFVEDYFENFLEKNNHLISVNKIDIKKIGKANSFFDEYHKTAEKTLNKILKINLSPKERPYSKFWKHFSEEEWEKVKGFGVYGEEHQKFENYTQEEFQELLKIQEKITNHAIEATCKILLFL